MFVCRPYITLFLSTKKFVAEQIKNIVVPAPITTAPHKIFIMSDEEGSNRRSERLSLNINIICVCEYVSESVPLQIMLGIYLVLCKSVDSLVILENLTISYYSTIVPIFYVLITYSRQHDILIPTYIGMSSLYQVLNCVCS
jgi:hypothetical protein